MRSGFVVALALGWAASGVVVVTRAQQPHTLVTSGIVVQLPAGWTRVDRSSDVTARSADGREWFHDDGAATSIVEFMTQVDSDPGYRHATHPLGRILYLRTGDGHDYRFFVKIRTMGWTFTCRAAGAVPARCLAIAQTARLAP